MHEALSAHILSSVKPSLKQHMMTITHFATGGSLKSVLQDVEDATNIDSMEDITVDLIQSFRLRISRPLGIPGFPVTLNKYQEWEKKQPQESLQGVEYDSRQACLLLRPLPMHPSTEAFNAIVYWMRTLVEGLGDDNPNGWSLQHDKPYLLTGQYEGIVKRPLAALISSRNIRPSIIVQVAINETRMELLDNVKQWLFGSNGRVKLVILVESEELHCPNIDDIWTKDIECGLFDNFGQIATQIFEIEKTEKNPSIMGQMLTRVWFVSQENCSEEASDLPTPSYTLKCGHWKGSQNGSVSESFAGATPFVDSKFSMHLHGISLSFPFQIFGDFVQRGGMEFIRQRANGIAHILWVEYKQNIVQENIIKAGYGPEDLRRKFHPNPYC